MASVTRESGGSIMFLFDRVNVSVGKVFGLSAQAVRMRRVNIGSRWRMGGVYVGLASLAPLMYCYFLAMHIFLAIARGA